MITVQPRREAALEAGYAAMRERLPPDFGFALFCERLADWRVDAFCDGERAVGMLMTRDGELHVAVMPEVRGRWLSKRLIREVFAPIFAAHGRARTSIADGNARGLDFVRRIRAGFADLTYDPSTALGIGGSVLSGLIQGGAAEQGASQAAGAANSATAAQMQMFNTQNQQQAPYRAAGKLGLNALLYGSGLGGGVNGPQTAGGGATGVARGNQVFDQSGNYLGRYGIDPGAMTIEDLAPQIGLSNIVDASGSTVYGGPGGGQTAVPGLTSGQFLHQFNADDLKTNLAPNYQFMLDQGLGATRNANNVTGSFGSGNTGKALTDYAENYAGNAYQNAFSNYTANQTNIYNRLSSIAGLGQTANQQSSTLAGSLAPGISNSIMSAGQAQSAGTVGAANAFAGGANNAMGWYNLGNLLKGGSPSLGVDT